MSLILEKTMCDYLHALCTQLGIHVKPKSFQVEFFRKAVSGVDGFLRAPCGAGKSLLFQLLPYVLKHFRFQDIDHPIVVIIEPLKAISEGQLLEQKVPSCMLTEGGNFIMADKDRKLKQFSVKDIQKLQNFAGLIYSSPEVWDGKEGMIYKLHFSGRIVSLVIDEADKINQWGPSFRESYTRLGLLRPFMAENASVYFLTATATAEDMKVACDILAVRDELQMNICAFRGEYIKTINRPNSSFGWEGVFKDRGGQIIYEPGLRQLLCEEYLDDFFNDPSSFPRTVMLFRDQSQLGHTADIISRKLGYESPDKSKWIQFHGLVDSLTLQQIFKRFANPSTCYRLILMTTKGLCGTHIVDIERTVMIRPMSSPHDLIQLMGRGGRGPNVFQSSLEVIWNNSDLSHNVPGMTTEVKRILDNDGCIPEKLCKLFGYKFERNQIKCCSYCDHE